MYGLTLNFTGRLQIIRGIWFFVFLPNLADIETKKKKKQHMNPYSYVLFFEFWYFCITVKTTFKESCLQFLRSLYQEKIILSTSSEKY